MNPKKIFYISESRLRSYSRQDRKRIEALSESDGFLCKFYSHVDNKEIEYVKAREKDAGLVWCEQHGQWEVIAGACEKDELFVPPTYKDDVQEWELNKGGAEGIGEKEALESENGEGDGEGEEKQPIDYTKEDLVGKAVVWKNEKIEGNNWSEMAGTKILANPKSREDTHIHVGTPSKPDIVQWRMNVLPDGTIKIGNRSPYNPIGAIKGSPAHQQQKEGNKGAGKKKEEKWTKIVVNKCPLCKGEGQTYVKMEGKRPSDPMEWLDYSENGCGCAAFEKIYFKGIDTGITKPKELKDYYNPKDDWGDRY